MGICCCCAQRPSSLQANLTVVESESERDDGSVALNVACKHFKSISLSVSNTATKLMKSASEMLRSTDDTFEPILLSQWIIKEALILNEILDQIYIFHIPEEIIQSIILYTINLLPGIYKFKGRLNYGGSVSLTRGKPCSCQIVLNSRSEIVGGSFREQSFKYHITNGSYTLDVPHHIEFTKEYFQRNYRYKVYGQLFDVEDENSNALTLQFRGKWKMKNGARSGNIIMNCVQNKKKYKLRSGKYTFYGYVDYLDRIMVRIGLGLGMGESDDNRQRVKLTTTLYRDDFSVGGAMQMLTTTKPQGGDKFTVMQKESQWDEYGGIHVVFDDGHKMDGFFNGKDFMGVLKDKNDQRFGHFHFKKMHHVKDQDEEEKNQDEDLRIESPNFTFQRAKSLDSDEDE